MPLLRWSDSYRLGVYVFDAEHMQFIALINELYEVLLSGVNEAAVAGILNRVENFAERHFAHEEEFFRVSGYGGAAAHREEHAHLLREIGQFREQLMSGDGRIMAVDLNLFLVRWFSDHTLGPDREFCNHLISLGIR